MSQILEKLIYRANIFNYDNKFLEERATLQLNADLVRQQADTIQEFIKDGAEDQLRNVLSIRKEDKKEVEKENPMNLVPNDSKEKQQKAKQFLRALFEMIQISQKKVAENNSSYHNNLLYGLLYLDGLIMMDIEVVKVFSEYFQQISLEFTREMKSIMNGKFNEDPAKEISSHILSAYYSFNNPEVVESSEWFSLMKWTSDFSLTCGKDYILTSNFSLILTYDVCVDYFINSFDRETRTLQKFFEFIVKDFNINFIYESLFCIWNITNNRNNIELFIDSKNKYLENIIQVIKTNKVDKIARIVLMIINNLLENEVCLENLLDMKFMRTIDILLSHKWSDPSIKEELNAVYDYLDKNYKFTNSFEKFMKEIDSGILKWGVVHTTNFWEDNYKAFEFNKFTYVEKLVRILESDIATQEMKSIACFDIGEFARLYPGGSSILEEFNAKKTLMKLVEQTDIELKNRALVCLQKIMIRSLKK